MASKRNINALNSSRRATTEKFTAKDREAEERREDERGSLSSINLDRIKLRASDTRKLNEKHVASLMESIAALGLIESLAVDQDKVLLAGGHRLAAIKLLQETDRESFDRHFPNNKAPVRIMPFQAAEDAERALQVEIAENEHRRDYTPSEVREIANHLRDAGYRDSGGRPKEGEKALMPVLSVLIGKNKRTIQRYLSDTNSTKTTTDVAVYLTKASKALKQWGKHAKKSKRNKELLENLPNILSMIEEAQS